MSVDLHWEYYPKECSNKLILPFLTYETGRWLSDKSVSKEFWASLDELSEWDSDNHCWIFTDVVKLFEFAVSTEVPAVMSDFIAECEYLLYSGIKHKSDDIFVVWKR